MTKINRTKKRQKRHLKIRQNIIGTKTRPRLCIFRSNTNIEAQIIDDSNHITITGTSSVAMKIPNGGNIAAAILVGAEIAKKAKTAKITTVVFDRGGNLYHGRVKALAEAAKKEGLNF